MVAYLEAGGEGGVKDAKVNRCGALVSQGDRHERRVPDGAGRKRDLSSRDRDAREGLLRRMEKGTATQGDGNRPGRNLSTLHPAPQAC